MDVHFLVVLVIAKNGAPRDMHIEHVSNRVGLLVFMDSCLGIQVCTKLGHLGKILFECCSFGCASYANVGCVRVCLFRCVLG